jgi:hypothetical protein
MCILRSEVESMRVMYVLSCKAVWETKDADYAKVEKIVTLKEEADAEGVKSPPKVS